MAVVKPSFKAKVSAFNNNCGFNCIAHFLIRKILNADNKHLHELFKQSGYEALLKTFLKFYNVPDCLPVSPETIKAIFMKYIHPIDREAILGPVLREYLFTLIKKKIVDTTNDLSVQSIWNKKLHEFTLNKGSLTSPDDLFLLTEKFGIRLGYIEDKSMKEPKFINEIGETLIIHNNGNHWEFQTDLDTKFHNSCYDNLEIINAMLSDSSTDAKVCDNIAKSSGAVFWGTFSGTSKSATIKEEINKQIREDLFDLSYDYQFDMQYVQPLLLTTAQKKVENSTPSNKLETKPKPEYKQQNDVNYKLNGNSRSNINAKKA